MSIVLFIDFYKFILQDFTMNFYGGGAGGDNDDDDDINNCSYI